MGPSVITTPVLGPDGAVYDGTRESWMEATSLRTFATSGGKSFSYAVLRSASSAGNHRCSGISGA
jgi:hypothetical protein